MRRAIRRTLKILLYLALLVVALVGGLAVLSQTQFFKDRLRVIVASTLTDQINGRIALGTIHGDFLNGFTLDSLAVYMQDGPVIRTGTIAFTYTILPFLERKVILRSCIVQDPVIDIRRTAAGAWNIARIFKASADTGAAEFTGTARIENLEIKNATISVLDSTELAAGHLPDGRHVDYGNLTVRGLFLRASVGATRGTWEGTIHHASFNLDSPEFHLTHLKGSVRLNDKGVWAQNWILQTGASYLEWDGSLRGPHLLRRQTLASLQNDSAALSLRARNADFGELKMLLAPLDFLEGSASLDLRCAGTFGDITVEKLDVGFSQSTLHVGGALRNLHTPEQLTLATGIGESRINPRDIARLMPTFGIPRFDSVGTTLLTAQFTGRPLDFRAKVALKARSWNADVQGTMNLEDSIARYDLAVTTSSVNLQKFFDTPSLSSSITGHGTVRGSGFTIASLSNALNVTVDSSRFRNMAVDHAEIVLATERRRINGTALLRAGSRRADLSVHADLSNATTPIFSGDVSLGSFDLASLFGPSYESDLTLNAHLEGSGSTIDNLNTESKIALFGSKFRGRQYEGEEWSVSLDQRDPIAKRLSVSTPLANIDLNGRFDIDYAAATLANRLAGLVTAVRNHALPPDSVRPAGVRPLPPSHSVSARTMDFAYRCELKKLAPIAEFFETRQFDGRGTLEGTIRSTPEDLFVSCKGALDEFYLGTSERGFLMNDVILSCSLDSLRDDDPLDHLSAAIALQSASALVNKARLNTVTTGLKYHNTRGSVAFAGIADSTYGLTIDGELSIQPGTYVFDLDTMLIDIGPYRWANRQDVQFRLNSEGTRVMHAEIAHNDALVSGAGIIRYDGTMEGSGLLKGYDLAELNLWLPTSRFQSASRHFSGLADAQIDIAGSLEDPRIAVDLTAEHVTYRQSPIGRVATTFRYADTLARLDVAVRGEGPDSASSLTLRGALPVNLGFAGVEERFPDKSQSLSLSSSQFDLAILDPFIAEVEDLTGKCTADIGIHGTPRAPEFSGTFNLQNATFIFTPNNVVYTLNGDFHPSGNKVEFGTVTLTNRPVDGRQATASLHGTVTIADYAIDRFDITASGRMLLMTDATRQTLGTLYGILVAETDQDGLRLSGSLAHPELAGKLYVRDANLTFPPTREFAPATNQIMIHHIVVDDTTQRRRSVPRRTAYYVAGPVGTSDNAVPGQSLTFLESLRYNLQIETRGTTAIRMVFTPATNEELYAELEGRVSMMSVQGTPRVYGEITVLPHSYYNFFKRFDATGSIKYVGPWDNPELNIKATYEGYHLDDSLARAGLNGQQRVTVVLDITGKRYEPKLAMSMSVQQQPGEQATEWSMLGRGGDVQSDAISFILTGRFRDEMTSSDRRYLTTNVGSTAGSSVTSNLLSGILTNFLRSEFPGIRNAEITYQGGNPDVRITADVLKGYLQFGGKILNNFSNANVSYQVNLGEFFNNPSIRNLFLEIQHRDSDLTEERKTDEARIYYRFSF